MSHIVAPGPSRVEGDVVDGYGSYGPDGDWGGYGTRQGPELLGYRAALFDTPQRMVFGATTLHVSAPRGA